MWRTMTVALSMLVAGAPLAAAELWVMHGGAGGECNQIRWTTDTLFLNRSSAPAVVRLLGLSDGPDDVIQREITLPPNALTSIAGTAAFAWRPASAASSFFLHLDVPAEVVTTNVLNVGKGDCHLGAPEPDASTLFGTIALPKFTAPTPAGERRDVLGTDLGLLSARTNVGVYNVSSEPAVADVQLLRGCDGQLLDRATFQVAPNSSRQVSLNARSLPPCTARRVQEWVNDVAITVSQPSISYVASVINGEVPRVLLGVQ